MAEQLRSEIRDQIDDYLERKTVPDRLPARLTLQALGIVAAASTFVAGIVAAGFGGWIQGWAEVKAGQVAEIEAKSVIAEKAEEAASTLPSEVARLLLLDNKFLSETVSRVAFPAGAVIAFSSNCPAGWSSYDPAKDRFILGAGGTYTLLGTGGEATHSLTNQELPSHSHALHPELILFGPQPASQFASVESGNYPLNRSREIIPPPTPSSAGGNAPHNNMPPYLVLNFCRKD